MGATKVSPPSDRDRKVTTPRVRATGDSPPGQSQLLDAKPSQSELRLLQALLTALLTHPRHRYCRRRAHQLPSHDVGTGRSPYAFPPFAAENATTAALYATDRWRSLPGPGRCTRRKLPRAVHQDTEQLSSDHSQTA